MPEYDPLSDRIQASIVTERDRLRKRVAELEKEHARILVGVKAVIEFNRVILDELHRARRQQTPESIH